MRMVKLGVAKANDDKEMHIRIHQQDTLWKCTTSKLGHLH